MRWICSGITIRGSAAPERNSYSDALTIALVQFVNVYHGIHLYLLAITRHCQEYDSDDATADRPIGDLPHARVVDWRIIRLDDRVRVIFPGMPMLSVSALWRVAPRSRVYAHGGE